MYQLCLQKIEVKNQPKSETVATEQLLARHQTLRDALQILMSKQSQKSCGNQEDGENSSVASNTSSLHPELMHNHLGAALGCEDPGRARKEPRRDKGPKPPPRASTSKRLPGTTLSN